ncbi:hypothetical protein DFJ77DRAFT_544286 [Powellomyces hirtus]|nr:hypothetical protein DFJ77DRAFT_544286 [Powellomyces hirtus]
MKTGAAATRTTSPTAPTQHAQVAHQPPAKKRKANLDGKLAADTNTNNTTTHGRSSGTNFTFDEHKDLVLYQLVQQHRSDWTKIHTAFNSQFGVSLAQLRNRWNNKVRKTYSAGHTSKSVANGGQSQQ